MSTDIEQLSDPDIDIYEAHQRKGHIPQGCLTPSIMDGFLTGTALLPAPIDPDALLDMILTSNWRSYMSASSIYEVIPALINWRQRIKSQIRNGDFVPVYELLLDGTISAENWARGFCAAIGFLFGTWKPLLQSEEGRKLLSPIKALAGLADTEFRALSPDKKKEFLASALDQVPESVLGMHRAWKRLESGALKRSKARGFVN